MRGGACESSTALDVQVKLEAYAPLDGEPTRAGLRIAVAGDPAEIAASWACIGSRKTLVVEDVVNQEAGLQRHAFHKMEGPGYVAIDIVHAHLANSVDAGGKDELIVGIRLATRVRHETIAAIGTCGYAIHRSGRSDYISRIEPLDII